MFSSWIIAWWGCHLYPGTWSLSLSLLARFELLAPFHKIHTYRRVSCNIQMLPPRWNKHGFAVKHVESRQALVSVYNSAPPIWLKCTPTLTYCFPWQPLLKLVANSEAESFLFHFRWILQGLSYPSQAGEWKIYMHTHTISPLATFVVHPFRLVKAWWLQINNSCKLMNWWWKSEEGRFDGGWAHMKSV